MKKLVALLLSLCLLCGMMAFASAETKTASAQGFGSSVTVTVTVEDGKITAIDVDDSGESYPVARADSVEKVIAAIIEANGTEGVDVNTGATFTCTAIVEAVNKALAEEAAQAAEPVVEAVEEAVEAVEPAVDAVAEVAEAVEAE